MPQQSVVPPMALLHAPTRWRVVDIISDLHLMPSNFDRTEAVLGAYLASTPADALFILGDLFEVWIGDDAAETDPFAAQCAALLLQVSARCDLFFMHGNRDFLVGDGLMRRCDGTLLQDPTVLLLDDRRWLLTHGDALCLADTEYMAFRAQVRQPQYQRDFLDRPLTERSQIARHMREQSEARNGAGVEYADVDAQAARQWLLAADAPVMIHGHTHKPAEHGLGANPAASTQTLSRIVLSDWDAAADPPRQQVLRLEAGSAALPRRLDL